MSDRMSDDELALGLGDWLDGTARYVEIWGKWLFWDGCRWRIDQKLQHFTEVRKYLRRFGTGVEKSAVVDVVTLAKSNPEIAAGSDEWDADAWLLNTPKGIVDLTTGRLRASDPTALMTKLTAYSPSSAKVPAWEGFLERIFAHDLELVPFVQRMLGYAMTGSIREHKLFFAWGQGGNGKGTLFNLVGKILGDYGKTAPGDLLLASNNERHPTDLAMLRGSRLVTMQEIGIGRSWDEVRLKSLSGGDPVTARFMRQDYFTYEPTFKMIVAANNKPNFKSVDAAIKRRLVLIPFLQNIGPEEMDVELPAKLEAEAAGILGWMIRGCLDYLENGLQPPNSCLAASADYLEGEDELGTWLEERCIVSPSLGMCSTTALYNSWKDWAEKNGTQPGKSKSFSERMADRGFAKHRTGAARGFLGVGLAS